MVGAGSPSGVDVTACRVCNGSGVEIGQVRIAGGVLLGWCAVNSTLPTSAPSANVGTVEFTTRTIAAWLAPMGFLCRPLSLTSELTGQQATGLHRRRLDEHSARPVHARVDLRKSADKTGVSAIHHSESRRDLDRPSAAAVGLGRTAPLATGKGFPSRWLIFCRTSSSLISAQKGCRGRRSGFEAQRAVALSASNCLYAASAIRLNLSRASCVLPSELIGKALAASSILSARSLPRDQEGLRRRPPYTLPSERPWPILAGRAQER